MPPDLSGDMDWLKVMGRHRGIHRPGRAPLCGADARGPRGSPGTLASRGPLPQPDGALAAPRGWCPGCCLCVCLGFGERVAVS